MLNKREDVTISQWTDHAQIAIVPVINAEVFLAGHGGPCIQPHLSHLTPDIANSGWRDYGNRQGNQRLLDIFSELNLPVSIALNSYMIKQEPDVFQSILNACVKENSLVDIIGHGLTNSLSAVKHLTYEEQVKQSLDELHAVLPEQMPVTAWLSPGFAAPDNAANILAHHGIRMSLDATDDDVIYRLKSSANIDQSLLILPYSMETNDISLCISKGYTGEQYASTLIDHVEYLRSERRSEARVVCFGLHTFIVGTPAKALHFKSALQKIMSMSNVCFMNCTQLLKKLEK